MASDNMFWERGPRPCGTHAISSTRCPSDNGPSTRGKKDVCAEEVLNGLYFAHSGLRYLILLAGVVAVIYGIMGIIGSRPHDKGMTIIGASFAGLVHLQVLLGLGLVFAGRFYPAVWGHLVAMLFAAVLAQLPASVNRRRPRAQRSFWPHIICSALALLMIAGGIMAIGRSPLGSVMP